MDSKLLGIPLWLIAGGAAAYWYFGKGAPEPKALATPPAEDWGYAEEGAWVHPDGVMTTGAQGGLGSTYWGTTSGAPCPQGQPDPNLPQQAGARREPQGGGGVVKSPQGQRFMEYSPQGRTPKCSPQSGSQFSRVLGLPAGVGGY